MKTYLQTPCQPHSFHLFVRGTKKAGSKNAELHAPDHVISIVSLTWNKMTSGFITWPQSTVSVEDVTTYLTESEAWFRIFQGLLPIGMNLITYGLDYSTTRVLRQFRKGHNTTTPCTLVHPSSLLPIPFAIIGTLRAFWCTSRALE